MSHLRFCRAIKLRDKVARSDCRCDIGLSLKYSTSNYIFQNSFARAVVKAAKSCHFTPIFRSLHWLTITERNEYKLLSLTYKLLPTTQPSYMHNVITVQQTPRSIRPHNFISCHSLSLVCRSTSSWSSRSICFTVTLQSVPLSLRQPRPSLSNSDSSTLSIQLYSNRLPL